MATSRQGNVQSYGMNQQNLTTNNNRQARSPNAPTITVEQESKPTVATDEYHHRETIWRIVLDIVTLLILIIVTILSYFLATPFTRGFTCADTSIKYPYKSDTIPVGAAIALSIGLPIIWMWVTEICKWLYFTHYPKQVFVTRLELCGKSSVKIPPIVRNLYVLTVIFAYGYLATWVITDVTKNFIGELRPHFLAVCQPSFNCSGASLSQFFSYLQYGTDYTCLNTNDALVREARRSFFSGHSSPMFYGCGWLIMYIHVSWSWRHLGLLGHLFQVGLAILALYVGYTRISDFFHHWHDVFTGAIVGSLIAFVTFKFILNWHNYSTKFLPYTVHAVQAKPLPVQNERSRANDTHRISPNDYYEQHPNY